MEVVEHQGKAVLHAGEYHLQRGRCATAVLGELPIGYVVGDPDIGRPSHECVIEILQGE